MEKKATEEMGVNLWLMAAVVLCRRRRALCWGSGCAALVCFACARTSD
jgi:hypothetical protein